MDIVLDSNIIINDYLFKSKEFEVVFDHLARTRGKIILPQIVFDEVLEHHKRELESRQNEIKRAIAKLNNVISDQKSRLDIPTIDIEGENQKYRAYLKKKLKLSTDKQIIPSKNDYLPELLNRAVKNIKPFRGSDKGMRDAVIWLSIKDYCLAAFEKQVIFLTGNVSDFAESKEIPKLHQVLEDECRALNIRVNLYKSVLDFVNEHSAKLSFITDDWIPETVSDNLDKDIFEDLIANLRGRFLSDWARDRHVDVKDRDYKVRYIEDFVIEDFGIYEMLNDEYLVFAVVNLLAGIEFDWYDYDYQFGPVNGGTTTESFRFHVGVSFKVNGATVTEFDFGEVTEA